MYRLLYKSLLYVLKEHANNIYRIITIVKYEIMAEHRDSKLGIVWSVLNPLIQIFSFWFAFGLGIRGGQPVDGIPYINWMLAGIVPWFFISDAIRSGTNSIHRRINIISKIKFPLSILPTVEVLKGLFVHLITLGLGMIFLFMNGNSVHLMNLGVLYYLVCTILFVIAFGMISSVLNMFTRDVRKGINASIRLLTYVTPILWTMDKLPVSLQKLMCLNPLYYLIQGYRGSLLASPNMLPSFSDGMVFWFIIISMFLIGSILMYKFKNKLIDFI